MVTQPEHTDPARCALRAGAYSFPVAQIEQGRSIVHILASVATDSAPPGIFLRLYILGGLCFVAFCAWFVLRGYVKSGDKDEEK
jgi:hypothetical protein